VTVHYKRYGQKQPTFILLHGYLGATHSWRKIIALLSELGTVVAYDRPAFGLTSRPMPGQFRGPSPYGNEAQAEMLIELMDALEIARAVVIGHSMGAGIGALAAARHPARFDRLVLLGPEPWSHGQAAWRRLLMSTPQLRRLGPVLMRNRVIRQVQDLLRSSWHDPSRIPPELQQEYHKIFRLENWDRGLWELARATRPMHKACSAKDIQTQALVVTGDDDRITGREEIIRLAQAMPRAQLIILPETGHAPHEESPAAFVETLREFLSVSAQADTI
jgi:pimeloyl-ACP methyl ester carboxylesterase